jgi:TPR repeat protein
MPTTDRLSRLLGFAALACLASSLEGCLSWGVAVAVAADPPPSEGVEGEALARPAAGVCEVGELERCSARCIEGDAPSCNNLGAMYELGLVGAPDLARALEFYERACAGGASGGCTNAARFQRSILENAEGRTPAVDDATPAAPNDAPPGFEQRE